MSSLCIVMPIYNEEESILETFTEWEQELNKQIFFSSFTFLLINDGSTDKTLLIINKIKDSNEFVEVINKKNSGHGQSCLVGYKYAFENKYDYVLQLDSDGQCDPKYLSKFLKKLSYKDVIYGIRYYRKDGLIRFWVSRFLSVVSLFVTGIWSWDPNVPFRLFKVETLENFLEIKTEKISLVNVVLALYHKKFRPSLVPIVFRDRHGGSPSVSTSSLYKHGILYFNQIKELAKNNEL